MKCQCFFCNKHVNIEREEYNLTNIRVAFLTLGCKVNYYETNRIKSEFEHSGAKTVPFSETADIYIVNTCTVTNIADRKSRKMLHRARRLNEKAMVVAIGCFAEANKGKTEEFDYVDLLIENEKKTDAYSIIMEEYSKHYDICTDEVINTEPGPVLIEEQSEENERTRAYVKVQDGCNQFCSYCKIPYVRGRLRSRDCNDVIDEITALAENGCKEVVITGIHLSSYGLDKSDTKSFVELKGKPLLELLGEIENISGIERIRLGSLEPRIITKDFLEGLVKLEKICPHFHLSLQSGCDKTLRAMNRKYTAQEYCDACILIKKYYDRPAITTDIIVGFPGETTEDFQECLEFTKKIGFSDIHVFKYSMRDGTKAALMENQIAESIKHDRSSILIESGNNETKKYISSFIGERQLCLVEEMVSVNGKDYFVGHNERYIKLAIPVEKGQNNMENEIVSVIAEEIIDDNMLLCTFE